MGNVRKTNMGSSLLFSFAMLVAILSASNAAAMSSEDDFQENSADLLKQGDSESKAPTSIKIDQNVQLSVNPAQANMNQLSAYLLTQQETHAMEKRQLQAEIALLQTSERELRAEVINLREVNRRKNIRADRRSGSGSGSGSPSPPTNPPTDPPTNPPTDPPTNPPTPTGAPTPYVTVAPATVDTSSPTTTAATQKTNMNLAGDASTFTGALKEAVTCAVGKEAGTMTQNSAGVCLHNTGCSTVQTAEDARRGAVVITTTFHVDSATSSVTLTDVVSSANSMTTAGLTSAISTVVASNTAAYGGFTAPTVTSVQAAATTTTTATGNTATSAASSALLLGVCTVLSLMLC